MPTARWSRRSLACFMILLPLVAAPENDLARWAPATGEGVVWRWRAENVHDLEELKLVLDPGLPNEWGIADDDVKLKVRDVLEVTVRDLIVERDEYDPILLERALVSARRLTSSDWQLFASSNDEDELKTVSPFEGAGLVFSWDDEAGELSASFADDSDESADEELLEGLDEGLDLRDLLGGIPRSPGDRWQLDEDALLRLVRPGGELALVAPDLDSEGEHGTAAFGWLLGAALVAGNCDAWGRAEYERVTRDGDRRVARIALYATIEGFGSVREALDRLVDILGTGRNWLEYGKKIEVKHTIRFVGVLLWDLDANRAHVLELEGRSESHLKFGLDLWDRDCEYEASLRGELHLRVETAVVE